MKTLSLPPVDLDPGAPPGIQQAAIAKFADLDAVYANGHFEGSAGSHLTSYIDKNRLTESPLACDELAGDLARTICKQPWANEVEIILSAEHAAAIFASHLALKLNGLLKRNAYEKRGKEEILATEILSVYAQKDDGVLSFLKRRGFDLRVKRKKVLLLEDVSTEGATLRKLLALCEHYKAEVIGAAIVWNRGGVSLGSIPVVSLIEKRLPSYKPGAETCPACRSGLPIDTEMGHGQKSASILSWPPFKSAGSGVSGHKN